MSADGVMSDPGTALVEDAAQPARPDPPPPVLVHRRAAGGPGRGRMLLLHGLANSAGVWDAFLAHHGPDGGPEVWAADLPWRGDCVAHWSAQGDVVPHVADALRGVPGGAGVVVGHSMGANSLLEFLHRRLEHGADPFTEYGIRALVLVSPFYRRAAEDFGWESVETAVRNFVRTMTEGVRVHAGGRVPDDLVEELGGRVRERVGAYGWIRFFETYLATPRLRTERFPVPCLVIAGEHDSIALPEEGRLLAADLPQGRFHLLPGSGHFLMIEQAGDLAAVVDRFVSTLPAA
ncbi:alpha/beta hydrolase [Kitasatospora sp. NA04385]|uniref:alpha/beta fold hydrolase n=1 Tax=Kitasatospora sp. NA04385 TaxID=2742135 RepID=UPI0015927526|nr:alpha/beta hydrolase [Kitasatospora sp. NA04385]QKW22394.1 alpha/beta hydrolase [Kitasatospora sp. NA04385]